MWGMHTRAHARTTPPYTHPTPTPPQVQCKNVAALSALCSYGADAQAWADKQQLDALALAADAKDKRVGKMQELLKQVQP